MTVKKARKHVIKDKAVELARSAGFNPDEMVEQPGIPSAPRWTFYLGQAKADLHKTELVEHPPMPQPDDYKNHTLNVVGAHEQNTLDQMKECMRYGNVVAGVLCPDGHLGYAQPVGGVIAYEGQISISGVGFDIGCGNGACKLDVKYKDVKDKLPLLIEDISNTISFGVGQKNKTRVDDELFDDTDSWKKSDMEFYRSKAVSQLGTVGSGNHYVDVFVERIPDIPEDECPVWIGVHFGSRGFGHTTATRYLKAAGGKDGINTPPAIVDENSEIGQRYIAGMQLAGKYAQVGREWVMHTVARLIGGTILTTVRNHHNYAWKENHGGRNLWVVRKGATPAFPGQLGFVGGSMGDDAVITEGLDTPEAAAMLHSTVHGAGRVFGRMAAKRTFKREQMDTWLRDKGVLLKGADLDESPMAYRRLQEVLAYCDKSIKVNHVLKPVLVVMAGSDTFDPWKD